jgi:hypothetical protein
MRIGVVPELDDGVVRVDDGLDDAALNPAAAAVDDADEPEAPLVRGAQILIDDRPDVLRGEGVKVEFGSNRDVGRFCQIYLPVG